MLQALVGGLPIAISVHGVEFMDNEQKSFEGGPGVFQIESAIERARLTLARDGTGGMGALAKERAKVRDDYLPRVRGHWDLG